MKVRTCTHAYASAFTLVEVLVSVSVLSVMMIIIADMMKRTQDTISTASSHATEYQEARRALDAISNSLSQASMDAIWAYSRTSSDPTSITGYERTSDHHFILGLATELLPGSSGPEAGQAVFFQAPMGKVQEIENKRLHQLMNAWGFFVQYSSDLTERPSFLQSGQPVKLNPERKRFRLMQYMQPAEAGRFYSSNLNLNKLTSRTQALSWYQQDFDKHLQPLADNVLAMVLIPYAANVSPSTGNRTVEPDAMYSYDSREFQWSGLNYQSKMRRHQLPAMVGITLIIAEEHSYESLVLRLGEDGAASEVRGIFQDRFKDYSKLGEDLRMVERELGDLRLHHQTVKANVALRNTHWISKDESL